MLSILPIIGANMGCCPWLMCQFKAMGIWLNPLVSTFPAKFCKHCQVAVQMMSDDDCYKRAVSILICIKAPVLRIASRLQANVNLGRTKPQKPRLFPGLWLQLSLSESTIVVNILCYIIISHSIVGLIVQQVFRDSLSKKYSVYANTIF